MAFFAESTVNESYDLGIVINENTDFDALALEACVTIQEMDNAIMNGIGRYELDQLRESGEVVYTEGMLESIKDKITKIWDFIKKWIKSVWEKFSSWLYSIFRSDKAFISKYGKKIEDNVTYLDDDFEYTMKYGKLLNKDTLPKDDISKTVLKYFHDLKTANGKEKREKILEDYEDAVDDMKDEMDNGDFELEVNKSWVMTNIKNITEALKQDPSKYKKAGEDLGKDITNFIKETVKSAEERTKEMDYAPLKQKFSENLNMYRKFASKTSNLYSALTKCIIKFIKTTKSDCRAICRKILTAKPNPKYNESAFEHKDFESYFNI